MDNWQLWSIGNAARNLAELEALTVEEQAMLLLRYLATQRQPQSPTNLRGVQTDQFLGLTFPHSERHWALDLLLAAPWQHLLQLGWIVPYGGDFVNVTQAGLEAAKNGLSGTDQAILRQILPCLKFLHPDLQSYGSYFKSGKHKEAVAAAFERYENMLNEIRDSSKKKLVKGASGVSLVHALYNHNVLRRPFRKLGGTPQKKQALDQAFTGLLSGAIGWIWNPYKHEKHHLPEITATEALELLFVASYLMSMVDKSKLK